MTEVTCLHWLDCLHSSTPLPMKGYWFPFPTSSSQTSHDSIRIVISTVGGRWLKTIRFCYYCQVVSLPCAHLGEIPADLAAYCTYCDLSCIFLITVASFWLEWPSSELWLWLTLCHTAARHPFCWFVSAFLELLSSDLPEHTSDKVYKIWASRLMSLLVKGHMYS